MIRILALALLLLPATLHAAPRLTAFLVPDRSIAMFVVAALFYFGFKWRAR